MTVQQVEEVADRLLLEAGMDEFGWADTNKRQREFEDGLFLLDILYMDDKISYLVISNDQPS